ncbi:MAG: GAF domain-containing protein [Polyangiaceae bacterium]
MGRVNFVRRDSNADAARALSGVGARGFDSATEAAQAIFGLIHELVGLRLCVLTRIDLASNTLTVVEASDRANLGVVKGMVLPADGMPCEYVVRSGTRLHEHDLGAHPVFRVLPTCTAFGLRSYVSVPLTRSDGTVWGTLAATDTNVCETTAAHLQVLDVLARLAVLEFEREEQRDALAAHAKVLAERLVMEKALAGERLRTARFQTLLETAVMVSHEINNPLTVLQLRLGRLAKPGRPNGAEARDDLEAALEAAEEIKQVTVRLRSVVQPVSTHYLATGTTRMIDLSASSGNGVLPQS